MVISPEQLNLDGYKYSLKGILCHDRVHYFSKLKISGKWFICDDDRKPQQHTGELNSPVDYIFVYIREVNQNKPVSIQRLAYQYKYQEYERQRNIDNESNKDKSDEINEQINELKVQINLKTPTKTQGGTVFKTPNKLSRKKK